MTAGGFDVTAIDLKDLGNPGSFAPPPTDTALRAGMVKQAADEVPEDGGNDGGPAAEGEEAKCGAGDGHAALEVGDGGTHGGEAGAVGAPPQCGGGGGKRDTGAGPGEQAEGFQAVKGGPEVLSPDAPDEHVELRERIVRDLVR